MLEQRRRRLESVIRRRQSDLVLVLEDVHDPHNISAVMRTADAVGVVDIYLIQSKGFRHQRFGRRSSASARKWLRVHSYEKAETCMEALRAKGLTIMATHLEAKSRSLYSLDLTRPMALVFGNEHRGVSDECLSLCDGNFNIPQVGMVPSLNISVACAVSLYEAFRQREAMGYYTGQERGDAKTRDELRKAWFDREFASYGEEEE